MTNNVLYNINNNKNSLSKLEEQYSTGKKIQRPSDDPIVATRALKLRTNLTELNQYYEKNIPDALAWMELTESALQTVNSILTKIHTYCVNGSTDTLTESDRNNIIVNLKEYKDQIFQEGNTNYAGRYVFSGYKTDTGLVYDKDTKDYNYVLTEKLKGKDIDVIQKTINSTDLSVYDPDDPGATDLSKKPNYITAYRMRLAYSDVKSIADKGQLKIQFPQKDASGKYVYDDKGNLKLDDFKGKINSFKSSDDKAYEPEPGSVNYLADTGEIIMSEDVYKDLKTREDIHITYEKNSFLKNDLRPEHYFDCTRTDLTDKGAKDIVFTKDNQEIRYEVNFSQTMVVNTQGSDSIQHAIGRCIDDISNAISDVQAVEEKIKQVETMLDDTSINASQKLALNEMLEVLKTEKTLKDEVLQNTFGNALTDITKQQNVVNVAVSDLGSRYARLQLTQSRLTQEQGDFKELLSENEDADVVDTIISLKSQEAVYNSSLSAAAKIVKNSLLDFL